jgi:hypothetical protein
MKIRVSSIFPAEREAIFAKLREIETLRYICAPMAEFTPVKPESEGQIWSAGAVFSFYLRVLGINFGIHTIEVDAFEIDRISTRERNRRVPVWNHVITLQQLHGGRTKYTDLVEIHAGWKTIFIWLWAGVFYRHRQRRWNQLLSQPGKVERKNENL